MGRAYSSTKKGLAGCETFPEEKTAANWEYLRVKIRNTGQKTKIVVHLGRCMYMVAKAVIIITKVGFRDGSLF